MFIRRKEGHCEFLVLFFCIYIFDRINRLSLFRWRISGIHRIRTLRNPRLSIVSKNRLYLRGASVHVSKIEMCTFCSFSLVWKRFNAWCKRPSDKSVDDEAYYNYQRNFPRESKADLGFCKVDKVAMTF